MSTSAPVPDRIGKYTITGLLGRGAMGVVYKGFDPHIQRPVAVKTIHRELLGDDAAHDSIAARFRNEAQAVGRLQHPGIVAIYEFGEDGQSAYIAMEFVEGRGLDQLLSATPRLPLLQVRELMVQLLQALECAHGHGVWHRDIKPANLLLTRSGQLKLTDFGIARIENAGLTQVASVIGTPGYMAPEQYIGEGIDHRADLFACGVMLYRLLTGVQPFSGTPESVMYKIMNEQAVPPSQRDGSGRLKAGHDALLGKALAKLPAERFQSARQFLEALQSMDLREDVSSASSPDDATVIVPQRPVAGAGGTVPGLEPRAVSGAAAAGSGATPTLPPTGWDAAALSVVERLLAPHVGPMARVVVRQAAKQIHDMPQLAMHLSQHISDEAQRQRFVGQLLAGSQATPVPGSAARAGTAFATPSPASAGIGEAGTPLSDADVQHALQVLTRHMGPIARILVKRAGDKARTREQLHELLLAAATDVDPQVLLKDLRTAH